MDIINKIKKFFNIESDFSMPMDKPMPNPRPKNIKRTIEQILESKVNDASLLILRANELEYPEIKHSINNNYISLWFIGSINNFDECTKLLNTEFKLDIYSKEIRRVIRNLGTHELIDVQIEAPYNDKLTIRLIWG